MKRAYIVTDLGFGDSNKGATVDFLARRYPAKLVIRANGGCQAGHNVMLDDGTSHTFSQFGSATFVPGVQTHLSQFMVVHPRAMEIEATYLQRKGVQDPMSRVSIDARALIITPFHQSLNRMLEISRGASSHGTCGAGVGQTVGDAYDYPEDAVRMVDLLDTWVLRAKLLRIQDRKVAEARALPQGQHTHDPKFLEEMTALTFLDIDWFVQDMKAFVRKTRMVDDSFLKDQINTDGVVIFEGAQGVLLDEWHGFHPHTTYSHTTHDNPLSILRDTGYNGEVKRLGLLRSYLTRHGQGPFPTEDTTLRHPEIHNSPKSWQGSFRQGHFDGVLARYAKMACGGVDGIVLGHLDQVDDSWVPCDGYRDPEGRVHRILPVNQDRVVNGFQTANTELLKTMTPDYTLRNPKEANVVDMVSMMMDCPVVLGSYGMTAADRVVYDPSL